MLHHEKEEDFHLVTFNFLLHLQIQLSEKTWKHNEKIDQLRKLENELYL